MNVFTNPDSTEWKDRLRFQMSEDESTNLQYAVWNLNTPPQGQDASRRSLELTIESPKLQGFLSQLDEKNISVATNASQEWFKKEMDKESIQQMYVHLVKPPQKDGLKHSVKIKVKCGDYPTNIFLVAEDSGGEVVYSKGTHEDLLKGAKCLVIVETSGLWFMSRQFGMSLIATDILVWPSKRKTGIDAFSMSASKRFVQRSPVLDQNENEKDLEAMF